MKKLFTRSRQLLLEPQATVLSAAMVIMFMIVVAQILGLVRQRISLHYFTSNEYSLFLAAFRLPDLVFEVFALGAFSAAFIPVFTKLFNQNQSEAWETASRIVNIGVIFFVTVAIIFGIAAPSFYQFVTPGYDPESQVKIAALARILFAAQGLFVISYVLTGVLESLRHFFITALAPVLYNLGIIIATILFSNQLGLYAPALGVVLGALLHLSIQLPLATRLGFRLSRRVEPNDGVKKVVKLASPRVLELATLQIQKTVELFFASIISGPSLTYIYLASSLQAIPITIFGVSLAKAALPTLTQLSEDKAAFKKTFLTTFYQMMFFVLPLAAILAGLRIPLVRLFYGTGKFSWEDTVQTGLLLSTFAIGIPFQAALQLFSRAFYAQHDTKTPVIASIFDVILTIILQIIFVKAFQFGAWSIGLANSIAVIIQLVILYLLLSKKLGRSLMNIVPILKSLLAAIISGSFMFLFLRLFDNYTWARRFAFVNSSIDFEHFVLDTRYTGNLMVLTIITGLLGAFIYLLVSFILRSNELRTFIQILIVRPFKAPAKDGEPLTNPPSDGQV